jgi:hypothetical protein
MSISSDYVVSILSANHDREITLAAERIRMAKERAAETASPVARSRRTFLRRFLPARSA